MRPTRFYHATFRLQDFFPLFVHFSDFNKVSTDTLSLIKKRLNCYAKITSPKLLRCSFYHGRLGFSLPRLRCTHHIFLDDWRIVFESAKPLDAADVRSSKTKRKERQAVVKVTYPGDKESVDVSRDDSGRFPCKLCDKAFKDPSSIQVRIFLLHCIL